MKKLIKGTKNYYVTHEGEIIGARGRALKPDISNSGYGRVVIIYDNGVRRRESIHRLVADYFVNNPDNKPYVNHIDGNKLNNRYENLEWVTASENYQHAHENGLIKALGEGHYLSSHKESVIREACGLLQEGMRNVDIVKRLGVGKTLLTAIRAGRAWRHISREYDIEHKRQKRTSEKTVHWVCKMIELGKSNKEIMEEAYSPTVNHSLLHGIRKKKIFNTISSEYNI